MTDGSPEKIGEALRWVLESSLDPSMAAADWLARDVCSDCGGAIDLLTGGAATVGQLSKAKDAFKTMRVVGETKNDRRLGGVLYAGAIAAAMVNHRRRISRQSDAATIRALQHLVDDRAVPESLRTLAGTALCLLNQPGAVRPAPPRETPRSRDAGGAPAGRRRERDAPVRPERPGDEP